MVVAAFPIAKLGALLIKQISKPISNQVKHYAKSSPVFRRYVCLPPAHFYNWCERKAKMWLVYLGQPVNINVLSEAKSIELGAELLGEGVIFIIGAGLLINEYNRSVRKETAKEEQRQAEMDQQRQTLQELFIQVEQQSARVRELTRKIIELETRVVQEPGVSKKTPQPPDETSPPSDETPPPPPILGSGEEESPQQPIGDLKQGDTETGTNGQNRTTGFLLRAIADIQQELWSPPHAPRQNGVVPEALNFLYQDVYRISIRF